MIGPEDYEGLSGPHPDPEPDWDVCGMCGSSLQNVTHGIGRCPGCKELVAAVSHKEWSDSMEAQSETAGGGY